PGRPQSLRRWLRFPAPRSSFPLCLLESSHGVFSDAIHNTHTAATYPPVVECRWNQRPCVLERGGEVGEPKIAVLGAGANGASVGADRNAAGHGGTLREKRRENVGAMRRIRSRVVWRDATRENA